MSGDIMHESMFYPSTSFGEEQTEIERKQREAHKADLLRYSQMTKDDLVHEVLYYRRLVHSGCEERAKLEQLLNEREETLRTERKILKKLVEV